MGARTFALPNVRRSARATACTVRLLDLSHELEAAFAACEASRFTHGGEREEFLSKKIALRKDPFVLPIFNIILSTVFERILRFGADTPSTSE